MKEAESEGETAPLGSSVGITDEHPNEEAGSEQRLTDENKRDEGIGSVVENEADKGSIKELADHTAGEQPGDSTGSQRQSSNEREPRLHGTTAVQRVSKAAAEERGVS